ncbi:hypothetical protein CAPTEDRAFT_214647 [Capitella teleta]|uniref:Uncharacterized protein n=1 Tax=Capitella teleta TaxID=283909 RepID=R7UF42_CAPTE|nr:hypothetical protein CAPTEDRAFT_214647 [Capitella teleta]|eukprot:ELU05144.1 hypothetical protein CAPTEDRAFT_214647 [Capitella teleta]
MQPEQLFLCLLGVGQVASLVELRSERLEKDLEKEILQNSVQFIKGKWTKCLRQQSGANGRAKRKTSMHISWMLGHQVEMSVLENTKSFLVNQLLNCRSSLPKHVNHNAPEKDDMNEVRYDYEDRERLGEKVSARAVVLTKESYPTYRVHYDSPTRADSPRTVVMNGRSVSCGSVHSVANKTGFECIDLRVDDVFRLPNSDLCPPEYKPDEWRRLNEIHKRTFKFLDLQSFCQAFGKILGVGGFVKDVKVYTYL